MRIGYVVALDQVDGSIRFLGDRSRALENMNWKSVTLHRESLAVWLWAVMLFRHYLHGTRFMIPKSYEAL